jgi:hypothetical protein
MPLVWTPNETAIATAAIAAGVSVASVWFTSRVSIRALNQQGDLEVWRRRADLYLELLEDSDKIDIDAYGIASNSIGDIYGTIGEEGDGAATWCRLDARVHAFASNSVLALWESLDQAYRALQVELYYIDQSASLLDMRQRDAALDDAERAKECAREEGVDAAARIKQNIRHAVREELGVTRIEKRRATSGKGLIWGRSIRTID